MKPGPRLNLGEPLPANAPEPLPVARVVDRDGRLWWRSSSSVWDFAWFLDGDNGTAHAWAEVVDAGPLRPVIERIFVIAGSPTECRAWLIDHGLNASAADYVYVRNTQDLRGHQGLRYAIGFGAETRRDWPELEAALNDLDAVDDYAVIVKEHTELMAALARCAPDCPAGDHVHSDGYLVLPFMADLQLEPHVAFQFERDARRSRDAGKREAP